MKQLFIPSVLTLCFFTTATAAQAIEERTISVTGTALSRVVPDTVHWTVSVSGMNKDLVRAKKTTDSQVKAILTTAQGLGVKTKDIQTGQVSMHKDYDHSGRHRKFKHYVVTRTIQIKQRGTANFDAFFTGLVKNQEMTVGYQLSSSKLEEIRAKTRLQAVAAAKTKAAAMAKVLGAKLGPVLKIRGEHGFGHRKRPASNVTYLQFEGASMGDRGGGGGTFAAGTLEVAVSVETVFRLR